MFAAPVKAKNVEYSHVDNNGHAMAPYMMSVGLFVACMAFTLMYPLMEKNEEVKSGLQWWLSKVTVMAAVSIAQAVIMVAVLMGINGLEPHYVGKTFGMAVLASMAFMSLICFGEMLLNRVGSYVMLVFMVVQLGAAGGTYPLDMAPHFYTVLHKYMPFSYTVHAFRHTLSMDGQIGQDIAVFVGILVVSTLATIIFYRFRMKKQVGGTLEPNGAPQQKTFFAKGEVISQTPSHGSKVSKNTTVVITVSKGKKEDQTVSVPYLRYYTESEASQELQRVGLSLGSVLTEYSDSVEKGLVIRQRISSGSKVKKGTAVGIYVSLGPRQTATTADEESTTTDEE